MEKFKTISITDINSNRKSKKYLTPSKSINSRYFLFNKRTLLNHLFSIKNPSSSNVKTETNNLNTLSFEKYDELMAKSLNKYNSVRKDSKDDETNSQDLHIRNYKKKFSLIPQNNQRYSVNEQLLTLNNNNSNPYFNIKVHHEKNLNYENPFDSLNAINHNNIIFNEISKDSLIRQRLLFNNSLKHYENFAMKFNVRMPKIKVSDRSNKISEEIPMINLVEDKKKMDEMIPSIPNNTGDLKLFSYFKYPEKNFPEGREQFAICTKGTDILLTGGVSTKNEMDIWTLNVKNIEWNKIPIANKALWRFGHTSIYNQQKIYFYGGKIKDKNIPALIGLEIYSFNDKKFYNPNLYNEPPDRRNHIAVKINEQMLIHGGVGINNDVLSDCYLLNFQPLKWMDISIERYGPKPKVFGHACCLVIPTIFLNHPNFSIYKFPEIEKSKSTSINKVKEKGLYIFGGKTQEDGGLSNDLWILLFGQKPLMWVKIATNGKSPVARYFHSMDYFEQGNYIIIHGGRNDNVSASSALNDTFVLDLENFDWVSVHLYSNIPNFKVISRYGHKSAIFSNKLLIFGGINNNNYIGSSLFIVNLDFYYSTDKKTIQQMKIEKMKNNKSSKRLKIELGKLKLGVVVPINLPPIK